MESGRSQPRVILDKRWALRDEIDAELVADFVRAQIVPMYERLSDDITLGAGADGVAGFRVADVWVDDQVAIADRAVLGGLFEEPEEQQTAGS